MSSIFDLTGKQVLVTGAASGIGRCVAVEASKLGASLILVDLNETGLQETLSMLAEGNHATLKCDLTSIEERDSLINKVFKLDTITKKLSISDNKILIEYVLEGNKFKYTLEMEEL